jgi:AcrR family transcriptional regulator
MSSTGAKRVASTRRRRMTPDARRAQIIASARDVFLRHGFAGTRVRDIAERAGITENLVYVRFSTKAEIYQAAVTDPLDALVDRLVAETGQLGDGNRQDVFERFHRVLLSSMLDTAPLLAVALFSHPETGRRYYVDVVLPRFTEAITAVISDVTGWRLDSLQLDVLVEGVLGLHFGLALDSIFEDRALDVDEVAHQLAIMFGAGIATAPAPGTAGTNLPTRTALPKRTALPADTAVPEPDVAIRAPARAEPGARMAAAERRADVALAAREVFVERGLAGARTKDIAERAGITEAFMFRVFDGKEDLYRAAIEIPAEELLARLENDIRLVTNRGTDGIDTLRAINERGIAILSELAPIAVVALFSEMKRGKAFYRRSVIPPLRRTQLYLSGVAGWDTTGVDPDVLWRAVLGIQFGTVVHHLLTDSPIDAPDVAHRLTQLIVSGIR